MLTLAVAVLALAACGAEDEAAGPAPTYQLTVTATAVPATSLKVEVADSGFDHGVTLTTTLECDPVGGTNPLATESCAQLAAHPESLEPVPADTACTMIFGGPEEARLSGTFQGEEIEVGFNRSNGCEIERWDSLEPLFKIPVD